MWKNSYLSYHNCFSPPRCILPMDSISCICKCCSRDPEFFWQTPLAPAWEHADTHNPPAGRAGPMDTKTSQEQKKDRGGMLCPQKSHTRNHCSPYITDFLQAWQRNVSKIDLVLHTWRWIYFDLLQFLQDLWAFQLIWI